MTMHRLIARNTLILTMGQAATVGSAMLFGLLVARRLGPENYGAYALAFAIIGMFTALFTLGTDQIVVREVARQPATAGNVLRAAFAIRLVALLPAMATIILATRLMGYGGRQQILIALAGLATGLSLLADVPRSIFQGLQRMFLDLTSRVVEKGVSLGVAAICLFLWPQLTLALVALIIGALGGLLTSWTLLRRLALVPTELRLQIVKSLLKQSTFLLGSVAVIGLTSRLPLVILSFFRPAAEVGLFSAAYSLVDPFSLVSIAAATALLPNVAGLLHARDGAVGRLHESLLASALMLSLPVAAFLALFGRDLLSLVYGKTYAGAALPMAILALNLVFFSLVMYLHIYLIAAGAQGRFFLVTVVLLGVAVPLNLLLAHRFGAVGTAVSIASTQFLGLVLIAGFTSPLVEHRLNRKAVSAVFAVIVMVAGVMLARSVSPWLQMLLAIFLYLAGLFATGGLTPSELRQGFTSIVLLLRPHARAMTVATLFEKLQ